MIQVLIIILLLIIGCIKSENVLYIESSSLLLVLMPTSTSLERLRAALGTWCRQSGVPDAAYLSMKLFVCTLGRRCMSSTDVDHTVVDSRRTCAVCRRVLTGRLTGVFATFRTACCDLLLMLSIVIRRKIGTN